MFWGCICFEGVGTTVALDGHIKSTKYIDILKAIMWPVIAKVPADKGCLIQEDNCPVDRQLSANTIIFRL